MILGHLQSYPPPTQQKGPIHQDHYYQHHHHNLHQGQHYFPFIPYVFQEQEAHHMDIAPSQCEVQGPDLLPCLVP